MWFRLCLLVVLCAAVQSQDQKSSSSRTQLTGAETSLNKRNAKDDNAAQGTGFHHGNHHHHLGGHHLGHGHHGHGKFFMYQHQPEHKHYEFGFKRGNDKHVVERYEKGGPHHNFKSKFRWHDHHGGHGERYWDYNHAPHHHHDDGGDDHHHHSDDSHHHHDDEHHDDDGHHGYHSEPVPEFVKPAKDNNYRQRRKSDDNEQQVKPFYPQKQTSYKKPTGMEKKRFVGPKMQQRYKSPYGSNDPLQAPSSVHSQPSLGGSSFSDVLGFDPFLPPDILKKPASSPMRGASDKKTVVAPSRYETTPKPLTYNKPYFGRNKKPTKYSPPKKYKPTNKPAKYQKKDMPKLAFDLDSGRVYDEKSGKWFKLVPE